MLTCHFYLLSNPVWPEMFGLQIYGFLFSGQNFMLFLTAFTKRKWRSNGGGRLSMGFACFFVLDARSHFFLTINTCWRIPASIFFANNIAPIVSPNNDCGVL